MGGIFCVSTLVLPRLDRTAGLQIGVREYSITSLPYTVAMLFDCTVHSRRSPQPMLTVLALPTIFQTRMSRCWMLRKKRFAPKGRW